MDILKEALALSEYTTAIRRHLHENPELSGKEFETVKLICSELDKLEIPYVNIPDGGVLATLDGPVPGKTVLLRADCDALPINELPNNAKKAKVCVSKVPGAAHMCGHDGHTAMLLTAAKILKANQDQIKGRVYLLFERGEEGGGNIYYIFKYIQENNIHIDAAFAEHTDTGLRAGEIGCAGGNCQAGSVGYKIKLTGKGGHGSRPDRCINPIDCFVSIYECIKTIRMNHVAPDVLLTNSMGAVNAGEAGNVIPHTLTFTGTCRFYDPAAGKMFKDQLEKICRTQAALFDCEVEFERFSGPNLAVVNNHRLAEIGREALTERLGDVVRPVSFSMGSESFAYMTTYYPGVMMRVGIGNEEEGMTIGGHNPGYDLDEAGLPYGAAAYVAVGLGYLAKNEDIAHTGDPTLAAMSIQDLRAFTNGKIPPRYDK